MGNIFNNDFREFIMFKKALFLFFIFISGSFILQGQKEADLNTKIGDTRLNQFKNKSKLIVLLETEDPALFAKIAKDDETIAQYYRTFVYHHNERLKTTVNYAWDDFDLQFKTIEELKDNPFSNPEDYLIIYTLYQDLGAYSYNMPVKAKDVINMHKGEDIRMPYFPWYIHMPITYRDVIITLEIAELIDFKMNGGAGVSDQYIYRTNQINCMPPEAYYDFSFAFFRNLYNSSNENPGQSLDHCFNEHASMLKDLTLLIPAEYFYDEFNEKTPERITKMMIPESKFKVLYPYKYEIKPGSQINQIIRDELPDYAYAVIGAGWNAYVSVTIMNSGTGELILVTHPTTDKENYNSEYLLIDQVNFILTRAK